MDGNHAVTKRGYRQCSNFHAQLPGSRRRHAWRPCGTGARRPRFACRGKLAAAVVPLCVTPRTRGGGISSGPAWRPDDLGAKGHGFFYRRFFPAMRRTHNRFKSGPCPGSAPGSENAIMDSWHPCSPARSQPIWSRSRYGSGMTAFFGFGATPPRQHGSPCSSLVQLCIALHVPPGGRPSVCPSDVCPEGHPPFVGRVSVHAQCPGLVTRATHHSTPCPSPVRRLGLRLGRGHFSVTAEKIGFSLLRKLLRSSSSGD